MFVLDDLLEAALAASAAAEATAATGAAAATTAAAAAPEAAAGVTALGSAAPASVDIGAALAPEAAGGFTGTPLPPGGPTYSPGTEQMLVSRDALLGGTPQQLAQNTAANMTPGQPMFNPANADWAIGLPQPTGTINASVGGSTTPHELMAALGEGGGSDAAAVAAPQGDLTSMGMASGDAPTSQPQNWFQRNLGFDPTPSRGDVMKGLGGGAATSAATSMMSRQPPRNVNSTVSQGEGSRFQGRMGGATAASMPGQLLPGASSAQRMPWLQGLAGYNPPAFPAPASLLRR